MTKKKSSEMKLPNFVKSNSLGMLAAAHSHIFHGPAMLHWEGGWHRKRKIQQVKPLLHIKTKQHRLAYHSSSSTVSIWKNKMAL